MGVIGPSLMLRSLPPDIRLPHHTTPRSLARKRDEDKRRQDLEDERLRAAIRRQAEEDIQAERRRTEEHRAKLERENMKVRRSGG